IAPRFLAGDLPGHFFVMEDLGEARSLESVLTERDGGVAHKMLRSLAIQTARLQAATLAEEKQFKRIRRALPTVGATDRHREAERWLAGRDKIHAWWDAVGCALPAGYDASC